MSAMSSQTKSSSRSQTGRQPGRPPRVPHPPALERAGIADAPRDEKNAIEVLIDAPREFKRLFALFKSMGTNNISVLFEPTGINFYALRESQAVKQKGNESHKAVKARVIARIEGSQCNHYFCAEDLHCAITRTKYDEVFAIPDKFTYSVTLHVNVGDKASLYVTYTNYQLGRDCEYSITLSKPVHTYEEVDREIANVQDGFSVVDRYPLEWRLEAANFKKLVTEVVKFSPIVTVEKIGEDPLSLSYQIPNKHDYREVYKDGARVGLRLAEDIPYVFHARINLAAITPLATSSPLPVVRILCATGEPTLYRSAPSAGGSNSSAGAFSLNVLVDTPQ